MKVQSYHVFFRVAEPPCNISIEVFMYSSFATFNISIMQLLLNLKGRHGRFRLMNKRESFLCRTKVRATIHPRNSTWNGEVLYKSLTSSECFWVFFFKPMIHPMIHTTAKGRWFPQSPACPLTRNNDSILLRNPKAPKACVQIVEAKSSWFLFHQQNFLCNVKTSLWIKSTTVALFNQFHPLVKHKQHMLSSVTLFWRYWQSIAMDQHHYHCTGFKFNGFFINRVVDCNKHNVEKVRGFRIV